MKSRISTAAFALAAALTLGACSGAKEQSMNDSAAGQTGAGTGTNDARGPNTTDTSAARGGVDSSAAGTTGATADTSRRDTTRAGSGTPRTTP